MPYNKARSPEVQMNNNSGSIAQIAKLLKNCKSILFITGAGISALVDIKRRMRAAEALDAIWKEQGLRKEA